MNTCSESTLPKPFVFVLMPFDHSFDDIYKYGIKGAADDVGAYAERLDDQIFTEGMLDRIFNQISKADVIVADMTGQDPNVFYEVGYAHALGKIVILLTQKSNDIPFDLKHRQHTVYDNIQNLQKELAARLRWAIAQSKQMLRPGSVERFSIRLLDTEIPRTEAGVEPPTIIAEAPDSDFNLPIQLRNDSMETVSGITHVYLFCDDNSQVVPCEHSAVHQTGMNALVYTLGATAPSPLESFQANPIDATDGLAQQFRLRLALPSLPPGAVEIMSIPMMFVKGSNRYTGAYKLRLHSPSQFHDYSFRLELKFESPEKKQKEPVAPEPSAG